MQNSLQKFRWFSGKFVLPKSSDLCNYLLFFSFKALHLGHIAKCFGLRDPPSQITGIGKGNWVKKEAQKKVNLFPIGFFCFFFYRLNFLRFFTRFCFLLFFFGKKSCIANFFVKSQCSLLDFLH